MCGGQLLIWELKSASDFEMFYNRKDAEKSSGIVAPITYCLMPIAYCLLPNAYCLLPLASCLLPSLLT